MLLKKGSVGRLKGPEQMDGFYPGNPIVPELILPHHDTCGKRFLYFDRVSTAPVKFPIKPGHKQGFFVFQLIWLVVLAQIRRKLLFPQNCRIAFFQSHDRFAAWSLIRRMDTVPCSSLNGQPSAIMAGTVAKTVLREPCS